MLLKTENAAVRERLVQAFEPWYYMHDNEADENMCYVKIDPASGFFHKDGTGYRISFADQTAEIFPFAFDTFLTEE